MIWFILNNMADLIQYLPIIVFLFIVTLITSLALAYHYFLKKDKRAQISFYIVIITIRTF